VLASLCIFLLSFFVHEFGHIIALVLFGTTDIEFGYRSGCLYVSAVCTSKVAYFVVTISGGLVQVLFLLVFYRLLGFGDRTLNMILVFMACILWVAEIVLHM